MKHTFTVLAAVAVLAATASPSFAAAYEKVLTWDEIRGTDGSRSIQGTLLDGTTAYNFLTLEDSSFPGDLGRITKVTDIAGTKTYSELLSTSAWSAASGKTSMTTWYGVSLITVGADKYLSFTETGTDAVWRVALSDGAITNYVSRTVIDDFIGNTSPSVLSPSAAGSDGEHYFYEGDTDSILKTNGAGAVETFISDTELTAVAGNDRVSGGITFDANGDLFWGSSTSDAMYKWDTSESSGSTVLTTAQIVAVTGNADGKAGFGDIFYAPDGNVYFYESTSDGIMSFDPADAANTLAYVLTEAEMIAGPAGSDSCSQLEWYDGNIAWTPLAASVTNKGFYAVPEPMTMALLGLGGLVMLRRRRKA